MQRVIKFLLVGLIGLYLVIGLAMYFGQRRLMYRPDIDRVQPASVGLTTVRERVIAAPDGAQIIVWHGQAAPGQPTLLYFHGNAGSLASRSERIRKYLALGRGVMMMTYRGYGGSTGTPSEADNVADAKRAYDLLRADGVAPSDIIIYGESLGSGVAVQVAAEKDVAGVILDAPYTAIVDIAAAAYPWLPVRAMLIDRYETRRHIAGLKAPLLIVHGERDEVVPLAMGRALLELVPGKKQMVTFPDAGHADHYMFGSYDAINGWIERLRAGAL